MEEKILSEKNGKVYWIKLNRDEKANAINLDMWRGLNDEINKASQDKDVRVIALSGEGRYFSAGEDLSDLENARTFESSLAIFLDSIRPVFESIMRSPKVVISVVNGGAIGIAVELVFASDLALAHKNSYFMLSQGNVGVGPALSLSYGSLNLTKKRVIEMLLTGRKVKADEALEWGMINYVYEDEPSKLVNMIAEQVSRIPELLVRVTKEVSARHLYLFEYNSAFRDIAMFIQSEEARKGISSFVKNDKQKQ